MTAQTAQGLEKFHEDLVGLGYAPAFPGARKKLRSTIDGVSIEVMTLEKLIELKLASGISAPHRLKDLADVQELIKIRKLNADFADKLDSYVRPKYLELEVAVRQSESNQE